MKKKQKGKMFCLKTKLTKTIIFSTENNFGWPSVRLIIIIIIIIKFV